MSQKHQSQSSRFASPKDAVTDILMLFDDTPSLNATHTSSSKLSATPVRPPSGDRTHGGGGTSPSPVYLDIPNKDMLESFHAGHGQRPTTSVETLATVGLLQSQHQLAPSDSLGNPSAVL
eukprot:gene21532-28522_t